MNSRITVAVAAVAVVSSALFAQNAITVDLSEVKGSPVAMVAEPVTNKLVLYPYTNAGVSRSVLSVDGAVKQLRERGEIANLVKKLVESGDDGGGVQ